MQNKINQTKKMTQKQKRKTKLTQNKNAEKWKEYSLLHDSFTEILSYENRRKSSIDVWQLNYI